MSTCFKNKTILKWNPFFSFGDERNVFKKMETTNVTVKLLSGWTAKWKVHDSDCFRVFKIVKCSTEREKGEWVSLSEFLIAIVVTFLFPKIELKLMVTMIAMNTGEQILMSILLQLFSLFWYFEKQWRERFHFCVTNNSHSINSSSRSNSSNGSSVHLKCKNYCILSGKLD